MVKITFKIGVFLFVLLIAILAINPTMQDGVVIKFVESKISNCRPLYWSDNKNK